MRKVAFFSFLIIILLAALYFLYANFTYSEGTRTGYLRKVSHKGFIFKTWEGDLYQGGVNTQNNTIVNDVWQFSVRNYREDVVDSLKAYEGKVVRVHYREIIKNMPWQGDTKYLAYKVELVKN